MTRFSAGVKLLGGKDDDDETMLPRGRPTVKLTELTKFLISVSAVLLVQLFSFVPVRRSLQRFKQTSVAALPVELQRKKGVRNVRDM